MYCIHCGEQIVASANFCGACGTKVIRQDEGGQRSDPTVPVLRALEDSEASTDPRDHDRFEARSKAGRHAVSARWEKQRQGADKGRT
jgi:hypothetical protein